MWINYNPKSLHLYGENGILLEDEVRQVVLKNNAFEPGGAVERLLVEILNDDLEKDGISEELLAELEALLPKREEPKPA